MKKILFVCTGNICRSPTAEAVFRDVVMKAGRQNEFEIQSAGTHGYHVGDRPDSRAIQAAKKRHISMDGITAQKLKSDDFEYFDVIIALDNGHFDFITQKSPATCKADVTLMMDYSENHKGMDVPDPYYGDAQGFEDVLDMLEEATQGLFKALSATP